MHRRSSSSVLALGAVAGGVGFIAFAALMMVGGVTFPPALFLALVLAAAIGALLLLGAPRGGNKDQPSTAASDATHHSRRAGSEPGTVGVPVTEAAPSALGPEPAGEGHSEAGTDSTPVAPVGAATPEGTAASAALAGATSSQAESGDPAGSAPSAVSADLPDPDIAPGPSQDTGGGPGGDAIPAVGGAGDVPAVAETASRARESDNGQAEGAPNDAIGRPPVRLDSPREGGADDLKQIRGVGPKLEETLNGIGIYHLDQIAGWNAEELAWVDEHLEGFRGRAGRDEWVAQARNLTGSDG